MFQAYKDFWRGYVNFSGRTTRASYWWNFLINAIIFAVLVGAAGALGGATFYNILKHGDAGGAGTGPLLAAVLILLVAFVYVLATLIPWLSIYFRRVHDTNLPNWLAWLGPVGLAFNIYGSFSDADWANWIHWITTLAILIITLFPSANSDVIEEVDVEQRY